MIRPCASLGTPLPGRHELAAGPIVTELKAVHKHGDKLPAVIRAAIKMLARSEVISVTTEGRGTPFAKTVFDLTNDEVHLLAKFAHNSDDFLWADEMDRATIAFVKFAGDAYAQTIVQEANAPVMPSSGRDWASIMKKG